MQGLRGRQKSRRRSLPIEARLRGSGAPVQVPSTVTNELDAPPIVGRVLSRSMLSVGSAAPPLAPPSRLGGGSERTAARPLGSALECIQGCLRGGSRVTRRGGHGSGPAEEDQRRDRVLALDPGDVDGGEPGLGRVEPRERRGQARLGRGRGRLHGAVREDASTGPTGRFPIRPHRRPDDRVVAEGL